VPADRRARFQVMLAIQRLTFARQRGDLPAVAGEAQRLLAPAEAADAAQPGLGEDLRALTLISLGIAELWATRLEEADRHLGQGVALAHRIGRPYLEVTGLAHQAMVAHFRSSALAAELSTQAVELARRHGWSEEPITGAAYAELGAARVWQGRLEEAEPWLGHAERTLRAEAEPATGLLLHYARGGLELARGRDEEALRAFRAAGRLAGLIVILHPFATRVRASLLLTLVRLGETGRAEATLAGMDEQDRDTGEMRIALAALRLAQDDPQAAAAALAPVLDGSVPVMNPRVWLARAFLLEAIARDALGDPAASGRALERALDLAEPDGVCLPFLLHRAPGLLERHARHRTAHAALISQILDLLAGSRPASPPGQPQRLREPLSDSETRILRYLPTNLSAPEIAGQLYLSVHTVKTHMRHIYAKLGAHRRAEAVERARALGLLAPASRRPWQQSHS
ncbi:MAG TPA: LuxR C-terminal-related transcriptional regulator, partial [Streptosporangiaceae bacterium]|nr:LuxR C-terminal-related transcriptional regulator [Streptosporangiaceae bacterium]